jgi:hypothetical protein
MQQWWVEAQAQTAIAGCCERKIGFIHNIFCERLFNLRQTAP